MTPLRFEDVIPAPKVPQTLPVVLSPDEVLQFLACVAIPKHRTILTTCYAAGLGICEAITLLRIHRPVRRRKSFQGFGKHRFASPLLG